MEVDVLIFSHLASMCFFSPRNFSSRFQLCFDFTIMGSFIVPLIKLSLQTIVIVITIAFEIIFLMAVGHVKIALVFVTINFDVIA